jgi:uncharacterized protein
VAFSGGQDSALVLAIARQVLGRERVVAVLGLSPSLPAREREEARTLAHALDAVLVELPTEELADPGYAANGPDRCFHCKRVLFTRCLALAAERGLPAVLEGGNVDDDRDYRPGSRAARELGIRSPLREAGLGKADIAALSRELGLPTWDKPPAACLASRIPWGTPVTAALLGQIERAEDALRNAGFRRCRARHHGDLVRIELDPAELGRAACGPVREVLVARLKALGYRFVSLDLEGYRTGSFNDRLDLEDR